MKPSWLVTVFLLFVVTLAAIAPTSAQQTHTLDWGVEVGEEFTYVLQRKLVEAAWEQDMNNLIPFLSHLDGLCGVIPLVHYQNDQNRHSFYHGVSES